MRLTDWVDPFHAVDGGGNCLPGPCLPFGLIRPGPDVVNHNTTGYASGEDLKHISHTHVSGTGGAGRYGNIGLVPMIQRPDSRTVAFAHGNETARPGYYATTVRPRQGFGELANTGDVRLEVTATRRGAVHRYTWSEGAEPWVRVDVAACIAGSCTAGHARWLDERTLLCSGTFTGGWGHEQPWVIHAQIEFSEAPTETGAIGTEAWPCARSGAWQGRGIQVIAAFAGRKVEARVAISFTSAAQARRNFAEVAGRGFDEVAAAADAEWEALLGRVRVEGGAERDTRLWHTLMMRLFTMPGDHGTDEVPWFPARRRHFNDLYCLWDSVRCANSLFTLLDPGFAADLAACLTEIGEQTGWIPDAWIVGASAQVQGGCSAAVLFAEAAAKGLPGFDAKAALAALRRTQEALSPDPFLKGRHPGYGRNGFLDTSVVNCASRTVEYSFHDHCTARLARAAGDEAQAARCAERAARVWESWHPEKRCFAPRHADGGWAEFDPWRPARRDFWNDPHFYEGTAHDYVLTAWHALPGLVERHGGAAGFAAYLDEARARMWHWKEINLHLAWWYHYAGRPDLGAVALREVMDAKLGPGRAGMADNEDMGAWSSWWLCGAMGLFPVPGTATWLVGVPRFARIEFTTPGLARPLIIRTEGGAPGTGCVVAARLNGMALERSWLTHAELSAGGELALTLGERPDGWGAEAPPTG
jgi:predicted alpha-1,2-mannosidase